MIGVTAGAFLEPAAVATSVVNLPSAANSFLTLVIVTFCVASAIAFFNLVPSTVRLPAASLVIAISPAPLTVISVFVAPVPAPFNAIFPPSAVPNVYVALSFLPVITIVPSVSRVIVLSPAPLILKEPVFPPSETPALVSDVTVVVTVAMPLFTAVVAVTPDTFVSVSALICVQDSSAAAFFVARTFSSRQ